MTLRRSTQLLFAALLFLAPFGTRYIWSRGEIAGFPVETGTLSLFATQIIAIVFVIAAALQSSRQQRAALASRPEVLISAAAAVAVLLASLAAGPVSTWNLLAGSWVTLGALVLVGIGLAEIPFLTAAGAIVASASLQAALAIAQFLNQSAFGTKWLGMAPHEAAVAGSYVVETASGRWLRAYGSLSHPNVLGFFLVTGLFFAVGTLASLPAGRRFRRLAALAVPLLAAGIFFSFSKSAVLALAVGLILLLIWAVRSSRSSFRPVFRSVLAVGAVCLVLGAIFSAVVFTRLSGSGRLEARSFDDRRAQLRDAAEIVADHPFWGVGMGEMPQALERDYADERPGWGYEPVHNVYLLSLAEVGIFGSMAWLAIIAFAIMRSTAEARRGSIKAAVLIACLAAMVVVSLVDHYLWSSWFGQLMFWSLCGLAFVPAGEKKS